MSETRSEPPDVERSRSFDRVADAYDRGRPSYPREAAAWLTGDGTGPKDVLELGAGTGKLTEQLTALGHRVTATDPSATMLHRLRHRAPAAHPVVGTAEQIPVAPRSVDAVVAAQAFHWFDALRTVPEVVRVLRPGGVLGLIWNERDERIPWVRRLGRVIGDHVGQGPDPARLLDDSGLFETVQRSTFRFWQPLSREALLDVVASRSTVATLPEADRARVRTETEALYDEYATNRDGLLLPYLTVAYRATVLPWAGTRGAEAAPVAEADLDPLLIDFR